MDQRSAGLLGGAMARLRRDGPYFWVTWLTKILSGENSCEWASWFRARHENGSWEEVPGDFDLAGWQMAHTACAIIRLRGGILMSGAGCAISMI